MYLYIWCNLGLQNLNSFFMDMRFTVTLLTLLTLSYSFIVFNFLILLKCKFYSYLHQMKALVYLVI